jgi:hypothetical protein
LAAETSARQSADTTLTNDLATEQAARIAADATLTTSVGTLTTDLAAETSARQSADTTLTNDLAAEQAARIAADATLTTSVGTLTTDLAAETSARQSGDTTLTNSLATEQAARIAGDAGLSTSVNNLTTTVSNKADKTGTDPVSITVGSSQIPLNITNTSNNWSQKITTNAYGLQLSTNSNSSAASLIKCLHDGHSTNCFEVSGDGVTDVASLRVGGTALDSSHLNDSSNLVVKDDTNVMEKQFTLEKALKFVEDPANGTNSVRIKAEAVDNDYELLLPTDLPADTTAKYLTSDTSGQLSWESAGGSGGGNLGKSVLEFRDFTPVFQQTTRPYPIPLNSTNVGINLVFTGLGGGNQNGVINWNGNNSAGSNHNWYRLPAHGTCSVGDYWVVSNVSYSNQIFMATHQYGLNGQASTNQRLHTERVQPNTPSGNSSFTSFHPSYRVARLILVGKHGADPFVEHWVVMRN